ncbi:MAG: ABC transporter substrate-binding protein [Proteobacteria bacterium]|nr:ABC transporter substrate-binding protein [Pseudomonadota bacterium]MBU1596487.1 ABC transporter substrate-binding protein [Pseudomonadota bacterium]
MGKVRITAVVLAVMATLACSREPDPIRIGAIFSVTGPAGYLGEPEKNTLLMLQEEINAKGGVDGRRIEVVVYDDASDVTKCIQAAIRLIEEDHVSVVMGPSTSGNTLAIRQLFGPAKIPLVSCAASEKIVRPVDPWVFSTAQLDRHAAGRILADARRKGYARLAILTMTDGFGQSGRDVLRELMRAQGLTLAANETFGPSDTDVSAQLARIRDARPDAIICWGTSPGAAVAARDHLRLGLTVPLYMSHAVASEAFLKLAGQAAEGVILPAGRLVAVSQVPDGHSRKALLTRYVEQYRAKYGQPPSMFGGFAYDAFMLVVTAAHAGNSPKPQDIRDNLERIRGLAGTAGIFNLSPADHNGLDQNAFLLVTVEKGGWKVLH